jgi:two-component system OmpR family response regulator
VKVLMLEDDSHLRSAVAKGLRRSGHAVDLAGTVEEARWLLAETPHDVVVIDVMLPDGDGLALCGELRGRGDPSPVLILTARDAVEDRVRGLDVGADDYLTKPFAFAELEARLRALARRGPSERRTRLVVGTLELDPGSHRAAVGSRSLAMTGRQFSLLTFFAERVDQVLTRAQILEHVWDWAFDGDPRIVDVYIRSLRIALGSRRGTPRIETIRGVGYALREPG